MKIMQTNHDVCVLIPSKYIIEQQQVHSCMEDILIEF